MKLYMHAAACSLSPHIICRELDIDIKLITVDRKTHITSEGDDYFAINGNGYVPALVLDDGKVLTEGPAIAQFLADSSPDGRRMLPEFGSFARNQVQSLLNFITSELHKPMVILFDANYTTVHDAMRAVVHKRLDWINGRLAGPYLTGEDFTIADAYLFVCLNWSPWVKIDLDQFPALPAFMKRVASRPAVLTALSEEGLMAFNAGGNFFAPIAYIQSAGYIGSPVRP
ncbi:glutathione S-transferase [Rhizobium sp. BK529]|uniref:glutathione binding-like protein n=1 Tax=unclassified Rhizobium TaxID=2613769 RepID=UPI00104D2DD0|nr:MULTISPECIES: glutathione binding-like protein [unclassified Rhizobium]MBB3592101.1 glutathione S-transferase [Rhizobium sp. BK529]TCS06523.1 glutathione S-transferase [Rhizobium sp. BK418]